MRGSRRRAAASMENPKVTAPCRIKVAALLQAPSAMLAAIPLAPYTWPRMTAKTIATANPFNKQATADLEDVTKHRLLWYLTPPADLIRILGKAFR